MADAEATGLFKVKADTSQAVKGLDQMGAAWGRVGEAQKKTGQSLSGLIDGAATGLAKFNLAVGGIEKAFSLVSGALDAALGAAKMSALEARLPIGTIAKLGKETQGLYSNTQLVTHATKGMTGAFALNEKQMGVVLGAATALAERGLKPVDQVVEQLLESTVKFEKEGLAKLGIEFEKTGNRTKDLETLMESLLGVRREFGEVDEDVKTITGLKNSMADLGNTLSLVLVPAINGIVDRVKDLVEYGPDFVEHFGAGLLRRDGISEERRKQIIAERTKLGEDTWRQSLIDSGLGWMIDKDPGSLSRQRANVGPAGLHGREFREAQEAYEKEFGTESENYKNMIARRKAEKAAREARAKQEWADWQRNQYRAGERDVSLPSWVGGDFGGEGDFGAAAWDSNALDALERSQGGGMYANDSFGAAMYGGGDRLAKLKADLGDKTSMTGASFAALSAGITAAVDAAITGSDSIGKAAAKASAAVLKSIAVESTGRALYESALALGSLAIQDYKGAALHGAAALKYGLAAAATGTLAAGLGQLGGGGGGGYGGGAAGPSSAPGGGVKLGSETRGGGNQTIIVQVGDGFVGDANKLAEYIAKAVREGERKGARGSYSTSFSG